MPNAPCSHAHQHREVLRPVLAFPCRLRAVGRRWLGTVLASHQIVPVGDPSWQSSPAACCKTRLPSAALLPPCRRQSQHSSQKLISNSRLAAAPPCSLSVSHSRLHSVPCKPSRQTSLLLGGQPASRRPPCVSPWSIAQARLLRQHPRGSGVPGSGVVPLRLSGPGVPSSASAGLGLVPHRVSNSLPARIWGGKQLIR